MILTSCHQTLRVRFAKEMRISNNTQTYPRLQWLTAVIRQDIVKLFTCIRKRRVRNIFGGQSVHWGGAWPIALYRGHCGQCYQKMTTKQYIYKCAYKSKASALWNKINHSADLYQCLTSINFPINFLLMCNKIPVTIIPNIWQVLYMCALLIYNCTVQYIVCHQH